MSFDLVSKILGYQVENSGEVKYSHLSVHSGCGSPEDSYVWEVFGKVRPLASFVFFATSKRGFLVTPPQVIQSDLFWLVVSNIFLFSPLFGEDSHFDAAYFSKGLVQPPTSFDPRSLEVTFSPFKGSHFHRELTIP